MHALVGRQLRENVLGGLLVYLRRCLRGHLLVAGRRLFVRDPLRPAPFLAYRDEPEVARYQDWEGFAEGEARGMILALEREEPFVPGEWFQFAVELKETGKLVGDLGFRVSEDSKQGEVGYTLARGRGHWGRATPRRPSRACSTTRSGFSVCTASARWWIGRTRPRPPSWSGLRREGAFVENAWFKGRWSSEYLYAALHREWLAKGDGPG